MHHSSVISSSTNLPGPLQAFCMINKSPVQVQQFASYLRRGGVEVGLMHSAQWKRHTKDKEKDYKNQTDLFD